MANDADYLYVYLKLYAPGDPFNWNSNYFFDGDYNISTGYATWTVGSELFVQSTTAYQQADGGWNEGTLAAGTVLQAPVGVSATEFEFSIDRDVVGVAGNFIDQPLITGSTIRLSFQGDNGNDIVEFDFEIFETACPGADAPAGVDEAGYPLGDLNRDCVVDLVDYAIFQDNFTGP